MNPGDPPELTHLQLREIANPDRSNLSLLQEREHCLGAFLGGSERIGPVNLINVDVVRSQPPQGCFDLGKDPLAAGVAKGMSIAPVETSFGRDYHAVAESTKGKRLSKDLLRTAEAVDRRRVD